MQIHIEPDVKALICPECGSRNVIRKGAFLRSWWTVCTGKIRVKLILHGHRVSCHACGAIRRPKATFADERFTFTHAFERYVLDLSHHMTIKDVALHLGVSWDIVKDIQKRHLDKKYKKPRLKHLTHIAIDELSIGNGHHYLTVVLDLSSGAVVFVGDGKGADALTPFWKRLRASHAHIQAVATDLSPAYISAVEKNLPQAVHVYDRFHVIKLYNEKLSELRRDLYNQLTTVAAQKLIKGTRWLLLKNEDNLSRERTGKTGRRLSEYERLQQALAINEPLAQAYYMKEELRCFWEQRNKTSARLFLDDWIARADASGTKMLKQFAKTLAKHRSGLLAYYDHQISTGPLEGTNTKIRVMQHQAYGFRDKQFFKLKIYDLHNARYALVG
jgi:transposase